MNPSTYINSGVLELYVLDRLSPDERRQVEAYVEEHPEVRQEVREIELALERYALLQGTQTPPPASVLSATLAALPFNKATTTTPPTAKKISNQGSNLPLWLLSLGIALALAGLVYFMIQASRRSSEVSELQQRFTILEQDCERIRDNSRQNQQQIAFLTDANTRDVLLSGSENAPDSRAVVFYNPTDGEVLFSPANLPPPPTGKQYQLWAIDANGPQDLGVLDRNLENNQLLDVRFIPDAAAFAITLEDEGGKPTPDLTQLQVIGEVGS